MPFLHTLSAQAILLAFSSLTVNDLGVLADFPKYKILGLGVVDVQAPIAETADDVARTIESVARYHPHDRIWLHPNGGLNHLPRDIAAAKLRAVADGADLVGGRLSGVRSKG